MFLGPGLGFVGMLSHGRIKLFNGVQALAVEPTVALQDVNVLSSVFCLCFSVVVVLLCFITIFNWTQFIRFYLHLFPESI